MIKIIASDMDGTLLNDQMVISEKNADAIKQAQALGVHFIVSTGRGYTEVKPLITAAGFNSPMITFNGAEVLNEDGETLNTTPISDEVAQTLVQLFKKEEFYFEMTTSNGVYSDNRASRIQNVARLISDTNPDTPFKMAVSLAAARLELMNINYVDDYQTVIDDPKIDIFKLIVFSMDGQEKLTPLKTKIEAEDSLVVTSSAPTNLEINNINAQKGIALQAFAKGLNIPMSDVMAIGDNLNDVSMLKVAGVSYAMENGHDEVKRIANHSAKTNSEDGVGLAILEQLAEK